MMPSISVIIPTYKRPRELREAIDSVLLQSGVEVEVVVVDDCPDRSASTVMPSYAGMPVSYLANPFPSRGRPAMVRNLGWPLCNGTFLHFLDDDDVVPSGHYVRVIAAFEKSPSVGTVFGPVKPFGTDPSALSHEERFFSQAATRAQQLQRLGTRFGFSAWLLSQSTFLVCSSAVIKRECVAAVGGFDPNINLIEDVDFLARAIRHGGAIMIKETAINYRIHSSSLMHDGLDKSSQLNRSYKLMQERYKIDHGITEFIFMKVLARMLAILPC